MTAANLRKTTVAVVGAGMAGPLASILLARRGYSVVLYEKRTRQSLERSETGRSFNLTLTERGLAAFRRIDLEEEVKAITRPLAGRCTHVAGRRATTTAYGNHARDVLYSVRRSEINRLLLDAANSEPGVVFREETEFVDYEADSGQLTLHDLVQGDTFAVQADYLLGTDGVNSRVRDRLHRGLPADLERNYFDWAYKEFSISSEEARGMGLNPDLLHVWPASQALLIAIPNRDGSMAGDILLPREGPGSMATLKGATEWNQFLRGKFGDSLTEIQDLQGSCLARRKTGYLQTLSTSVWTDSHRILLMGDAAHGVFPFYGQGMNSALEDCLILDSLLDQSGNDMPKSFACFERDRKIDTDALCELSRHHFFELQSGGKRGAELISRLLPRASVYSMVAHTTRPYREALQEWNLQARRKKVLTWVAIPAAAAALLLLALTTHPGWTMFLGLGENSAHAGEVSHER